MPDTTSTSRLQHMTVHRQGAGEAVLLVHGITTYSFIWRAIVPLLAAQYEVITVDLAGCGTADMSLRVDYSLPAHVKRLRALLEQLGISKVHLVAHDVGGGIAQIFATSHPATVIDLTLLNSVGYDYWPVQPISIMRTPILRQLAIATLDYGVYEQLIKRGVHYRERVTPALMERFLRPLQTRAGRKAFLRFAKSLDNRDLLRITDELKCLQVPALIVRGEQDRYLSSSIADRLAEDLPESRLLRLPFAGHFLQVDEPTLVAHAILDFFGESRSEE